MNLRHSWFLALVVLSVCACQRRVDHLPGTTAAGIRFDSSVPADQVQQLSSDLALLQTLNLTWATASDRQLVRISDFSGPTMMNWLRERVSYVVGQSYNYRDHWSFPDIAVNYPPTGPTNTNPYGNYYPNALTALGDWSTTDATGEAVTIMSNFMGSVYKLGKSNKVLINLALAGSIVSVISPRVGGIKIDKGLFETWKVKGTAVNTLANALLRLDVLFHEAIHSDGRKDDVTIGHALCRQGNWKGSSASPNSSLNDEYACEQFTDGAYMVDATMLNLLASACTNCTNSERTTFTTMRADSLSRGLIQGMRPADRNPEYATQ